MLRDGWIKTELNRDGHPSLRLRFPLEKRVKFYGDFSLATEGSPVASDSYSLDSELISASRQGHIFQLLDDL
jgi:hypothetical protein